MFLEELLLYLRQQRRQLDESWRLLENMERQNQQGVGGASRVNVETAQSGTIPTSATGREGGQGRGGGRVGSTGVDLSSLYEHCMYYIKLLLFCMRKNRQMWHVKYNIVGSCHM